MTQKKFNSHVRSVAVVMAKGFSDPTIATLEMCYTQAHQMVEQANSIYVNLSGKTRSNWAKRYHKLLNMEHNKNAKV